MISDSILGAIIGGIIAIAGSFSYHYFVERRNRRQLLQALFTEIQHNLNLAKGAVEHQLHPWQTKAYHTISYIRAQEVIWSLPSEIRKKIFDSYDIIFAIQQDRISGPDFDKALKTLKETLVPLSDDFRHSW